VLDGEKVVAEGPSGVGRPFQAISRRASREPAPLHRHLWEAAQGVGETGHDDVGRRPDLGQDGPGDLSGSARIAASRWAGVTSGCPIAACRVAVEKAAFVFSVHRWGSRGTPVSSLPCSWCPWGYPDGRCRLADRRTGDWFRGHQLSP